MTHLSSSEARSLTQKLAGMTAEETARVLSLLVSATLSESEGAALLTGWAARGETGVELAATVRFLRDRSLKVPVAKPCFDLCGTGGSGLSRYNVSTTVAFIAAAAGVAVAKHGNRGSRRPNGSFDLLEALGVPFDFSVEQEALLQSKTGVCFLFARSHHPEVGKVVPYRKAAGCRTIFNLAGPLANPASIGHQIIGTVDEKTARVVAAALCDLSTEGALVVWGAPGIDEISVTGETGYIHVKGDQCEAGSFNEPLHPQLDYEKLPGGDAQENAAIFRALLSGEETGPLLDMVCVNAGAAIDLCNGAPPAYRGPGEQQARSLLASGAALRAFEEHLAAAQELRAST